MAGGIIGIIADIRAGKNAIQVGRTQRDLYNWNAKQMERVGDESIEAAKLEKIRVARQEKFYTGSQKVAVGASGITMEGSNVESLADTVYQFSMEKNLVLRKGLTEKLDLYQQAIVSRWTGKQILKQAEKTAKQHYLSAWAKGINMATTWGVSGLFESGNASVQPSNAYGSQQFNSETVRTPNFADPYGLKTPARYR